MNTMMHSPQFILSNSSTINPIPPNNRFLVSIRHLNFHLNQSPSRKSTITSARTSNKGFFRSQRSKKTLIQLVRFAASNLTYLLPEPLNSVIQEIGGSSGCGGGGGGGYGGFWKGFGWGGFDGGGGRKRKVNKKSQFWLLGFVAVCVLGFGWLNLGARMELKNNVVLGVMCLSMFLVLVRNGCVAEWVLGFCGGGVAVGLLFEKKGELQKLVKGFERMGVSRRQRRRRGV